jgi:hypothetical protein
MRFQIALLSLAALACGCNKPVATVSTHPVTGKIVLGGKPLEGATVLFTNMNPDSPSASGKTDAQGEFKLSCWVSPKELHPGAISGEYAVIITKEPPGEEQQGPDAKMEHATPEERSQWMMDRMKKAAEAQKGPKPKSEVPEIYSDKAKTPLKPITVLVGENKFDWSLDEK